MPHFTITTERPKKSFAIQKRGSQLSPQIALVKACNDMDCISYCLMPSRSYMPQHQYKIVKVL